MHRLSSAGTSIHKRIFPGLFFGISGIMFFALLVGVIKDGQNMNSLLGPIALATIGYVMMRLFVWVLVDEVWDDNDSLVVRNNGREVRIDLLYIININHSICSRPEYVKLTLREPCVFGSTIKFLPPYRFFTWGKPPVVKKLAQRIDNKRRMTAVCGGD